MNKKDELPSFVQKLLQLINNHPKVINWSADGTQVHILQFDYFVENVLPYYFRHRNFQSFVRQLNIYGFKKINRSHEIVCFQNEYFHRDQPSNYIKIAYKSNTKQSPSSRHHLHQQSFFSSVLGYEKLCPRLPGIVSNAFIAKDKSAGLAKRIKKNIQKLSKTLNKNIQKDIQDLLLKAKAFSKDIQQSCLNLDVNLQQLYNNRIKQETDYQSSPNISKKEECYAFGVKEKERPISKQFLSCREFPRSKEDLCCPVNFQPARYGSAFYFPRDLRLQSFPSLNSLPSLGSFGGLNQANTGVNSINFCCCCLMNGFQSSCCSCKSATGTNANFQKKSSNPMTNSFYSISSFNSFSSF